MSFGVVFGIVVLLGLWLWDSVGERNFEKFEKKTSREATDNIRAANKGALLPYLYGDDRSDEVIAALHELKQKIRTLQLKSHDYKSDYKVLFHFFSFILPWRFVHSHEETEQADDGGHDVWGKVVASWLASELLFMGDHADINTTDGMNSSCGYHGVLSQHDAQDCWNFTFLGEVSKLHREQDEASSIPHEFLFDTNASTREWLENVWKSVESHFMNKYSNE